MRFLVHSLIASLLLLGGTTARASEVLGYKAWKASRIEEAKAVLERIQQESATAPAASSVPLDLRPIGSVSPVGSGKEETVRKPSRSSREQRLAQALINVEIANELTVHDYFVLYLSQFRGRTPFLEVAKKLTPDEMADLLLAYKKQVTGSEDSAPGAPVVSAAPVASSPKPGSTEKSAATVGL